VTHSGVSPERFPETRTAAGLCRRYASLFVISPSSFQEAQNCSPTQLGLVIDEADAENAGFESSRVLTSLSANSVFLLLLPLSSVSSCYSLPFDSRGMGRRGLLFVQPHLTLSFLSAAMSISGLHILGSLESGNNFCSYLFVFSSSLFTHPAHSPHGRGAVSDEEADCCPFSTRPISESRV
jgi:hypothetical protein